MGRVKRIGGALALLLAASAAAAQPVTGRAEALLEAARREIGVPGMALAVWRDGRIVAEAAAGERALGSGVAVQPSDPFHIGSITKPITATLAARLVEQGLLSWDDTIGERLGPLLPGMREEYRAVTLADLLSHRAGVAPTPQPEEGARVARVRGLPQRRMVAAELSLGAPPVGTPRRSFHYSNYSYVVAAAMIEQATARSYEELLREEVLAPLGLGGAGFGAPGSAAEVDAPRGHIPPGFVLSGPIPPDSPHADNPAYIQPAGGLHMSMRELALFGADQVRGAYGEPGTLLAPDGYRFLHARVSSERAIAWAVAPGGLFHHDGSNLRWFALLWVVPSERLVVAIAANSAGEEERTRRGFWVLAERLRRELLQPSSSSPSSR